MFSSLLISLLLGVTSSPIRTTPAAPLSVATLNESASELRAQAAKMRAEATTRTAAAQERSSAAAQARRAAEAAAEEADRLGNTARRYEELGLKLIEEDKTEAGMKLLDRAESSAKEAAAQRSTAAEHAEKAAALEDLAVEARSKAQSLIARAAELEARAAELAKAFVRLHEHDNFNGRSIELHFDENVGDLKRNEKYRFGDKASSVEWFVPRGYKVVLYDDDTFRKRLRELEGSGKINELAADKDKLSSIRWEKK